MGGRGLRRRAIFACCLIVVAAMAGGSVGPEPPAGPRRVPAVRVAVGALPLRFEANRGQADARVRFLSRGHGYTLFLTPTEAVLALRPGPPGPAQAGQARGTSPGRSAGAPPALLRLQLVGASATPEVVGLEELPGRTHYFRGNDPQGWRTEIPSYSRVAYRGVYPGVDLVFYGTQGHLEYDLVLAPGADPGVITLSLTGADRLAIDARGDLVLQTAAGEVRQHKPRIYQEIDGVRQPVPGGYVLRGRDQVGVQVAAYDPGRPLVIDPVVSYSTYLGGSRPRERFFTRGEIGYAIAVDSAGNAYVTGLAQSTDFPTTGGFQGGENADGFSSANASGFSESATKSSFQPRHGGGGDDVFVTKLNATGSAVYSTYLGGSGGEEGRGIAVDSAGNAYVTGVTTSTDFPVTRGAFQSSLAGPDLGNPRRDVFITKLNADGSALVYSSYHGGSRDDFGLAIAVDSGGNAYVTGYTGSGDFHTTPGAFQIARASESDDAFVTKVTAEGSARVYSTYLGGHFDDRGLAIAVDSGGHAYVTGSTRSGDFPTTVGAFQTARESLVADVFVTKLNAAGTALVYSTHLGGTGTDEGRGIAVDSGGNAYVTGSTMSRDFPTTADAFQTVGPRGHRDGFVAKLNATGSALVYSSYLGGAIGRSTSPGIPPGEPDDEGNAIALDSGGHAYVTGQTSSLDFPMESPFQLDCGGPDAFIAKVNPAGSALVYSSCLGGSGSEAGYAIAVDSGGHAYVTGFTRSGDFRTTAGAFQTVYGGGTNAFVAKIAPDAGEASLSGAGGASGDVSASGGGETAEGGGGCLIATAAFGSPLASQVHRLRTLRDRYLLPHGAGRAIVAMYDRVSPPLARLIGGSDLLRDMVRIALVPMLAWAGLVLWSPGVGLGFPVGAVGLGVWLALRVGRRRRKSRHPVSPDPDRP